VSALDGVWAAIGTIPHLPRAACRGEHQIMDDYDNPAPALRLCARCAEIQPCGTYLAGLKPSERPLGIMAGQVIAPKLRKQEPAA
jgi:hypothetical protein